MTKEQIRQELKTHKELLQDTIREFHRIEQEYNESVRDDSSDKHTLSKELDFLETELDKISHNIKTLNDKLKGILQNGKK